MLTTPIISLIINKSIMLDLRNDLLTPKMIENVFNIATQNHFSFKFLKTSCHL